MNNQLHKAKVVSILDKCKYIVYKKIYNVFKTIL
jgi:hypothetical protein